MYKKIDKIIITKEKRGYTANSRSRDRQVHYFEYTATLLYNDVQSFEVLTKADLEDLLKLVREIADILQTQIEDHTTSTPFIIK